MPRLRWEEDFGEYRDQHEWLGYLGKVIICTISRKYDLIFYPSNMDYGAYTKLSSAKRGAERMLQKFLDDAGLNDDVKWV